jgi:hypothetical protein
MAQLKFGSAGVTTREIDISGPVARQPVGIPAGIVGTSLKGPAFVPVTVGNISDWYSKFGQTDGKKFGPLAVIEWLRNAQAVTYVKVLGVAARANEQVAEDAAKLQRIRYLEHFLALLLVLSVHLLALRLDALAAHEGLLPVLPHHSRVVLHGCL